jgi:hypothetical protein
MEPNDINTIEQNQIPIIEFDPEVSGIGVIATKPLDHGPEIELVIEEIFSCKGCESYEDIWLKRLLGAGEKEEHREEYLKLIRGSQPILKLSPSNTYTRELFWHAQYDCHCTDHFYEDLIKSVDGDFTAYFIFYPDIPQEEVNRLFKLFKGRTPYYTEDENGRKYNTNGYGVRGLYPRKSTTIQDRVYEELTKNTHTEKEILYYLLEAEEQKKVYPHLSEPERFRILSNTVHTPDSLEKISRVINALYAGYYEGPFAESSEDRFLIMKLLTLKNLLENENC